MTIRFTKNPNLSVTWDIQRKVFGIWWPTFSSIHTHKDATLDEMKAVYYKKYGGNPTEEVKV